MATYFHGNNTSEIQSSTEGLQTLYLMNPNYVPFSDSAQNPTPNMLFLNPNTSASSSATHGHALNLASLSHAPPQHHHHHPQQQQHQQHHHQLIGVTIPASNILGPANTDEISGFHGFATAGTAPRVHYNLWGSIIDQTPSSGVAVAAVSGNNSGHAATVTNTATAEIGFHRPGHQQGLSLSLSSQQPAYRSFSGEGDGVSPASRGSGGNGVSNMHSVVLGSKYLKAVQELLDEVVNVGKGISIIEVASSNKEKMKGNIVESTSGVGDGSSGGGENSGANKQGSELSTAQRQELQMKKSKLVSMLDEVEQRYRQYHHQMQIVISSFEQATGFGAARSYTALALKTISKQFRCLKDAISSQIKATSKTLGEDDCLGAKVEGSRLRYVDHHLRQQRALQQLGMIQHNAWRPQRGLPERAVSILRAWLFEHFLHPYPKDSDKVMLAKQTGLTRSQVSNWFINARVRLWKPMVEEMYMEEIKDQEQKNGSQDDTNRRKESNKELWSSASNAALQEPSGSAIRLDQIRVLQSKAESFNNNNNNQNTSPTEISNSNNNSMSASPVGGGASGNFLLAGSNSDMQRSPNKPRSSHEMQNSPGSMLSVDMEMKPIGETNREANNNTKFGIENRGGGGGYGAFSMEDIGRFNVTDHHHHHHHHQQLTPRFHGNGVSLTLGLPPSENNLPSALSGTQHGFLSQNMHLGGGRLEMGTNDNEFCAINSTTPSSHSGTSYDNIDMQNRKRFAAQLLMRDFVA